MNKAARDWCWTWWIPEGEDYRDYCCAISYGDYTEYINYMVQQLECKDGKRYHWQEYFELKRPMRMTQLKKIFGEEIHWEPRFGTREQARDYCKKQESAVRKFKEVNGGESEFSPVEDGKFERQGKRSDLDEVYKDIEDGKTISEVAIANPVMYIKFHRGIERYQQIINSKIHDKKYRKLEVTWIQGKPGVGKTRMVYELGNVGKITKPVGNQTLWFDGYIDQDILLIDDFDGWIDQNVLLSILDGYEYMLPIKGSFVRANYTKVFITSEKSFDDIYINTSQYDALKRRIHKFVNM